MLCMLKHTLFSCVYAKDVFSIHKITAALANLCISVHYGKLNLMLPSASKSQKIIFILMKCTNTVATRAAPIGRYKGRGRKGRGGRGNKHTRFKICGAAHANTAVVFLGRL